MRPATARRERTPPSSRPQTALRRPETAEAPASGRKTPLGTSATRRVMEEYVEPLASGMGWDYHVQRDEVNKLKERITQLEYKIATESKKVSAADARGQSGGDRESVAERQLTQALQWARSEAEVFSGIDTSVHPDRAAFDHVLLRMLENAGVVGMRVGTREAMAAALFKEHANPFARTLDLQKLRALVARQHQRRAEQRVRDWVRAEPSFSRLISDRVEAVRSTDELRLVPVPKIIAGLDDIQSKIKDTIRFRLKAYKSAQKTKSLRLHCSAGDESQDLRFGFADKALVHLQEGLKETAGYKRGLEHVIGLPAIDIRDMMRREHASEETFRDFNHGITSSPSREWGMVTGDESEGGDGELPGRDGRKLDELMGLDIVTAAGLSEDEVIGLRLFTGPMNHMYNQVLMSAYRAQHTYWAKLDMLPDLKRTLLSIDPEMVTRLEDQKSMLASLIAGADGSKDVESRYKIALRSELAGLQSERAKLVDKVKQEKVALEALSLHADDEFGDEDDEEEEGMREARAKEERLKKERLIAMLEFKLSLEIVLRAQLGEYQYVTTLHVIERGIRKLLAVQDIRAVDQLARRAWLGVCGPRLPACLRCTDDSGLCGAMSTCFISATLDKELALTHSRGVEWGCPVLLELEIGAIDCGVSLEPLSQFPDERDAVFPPFCCLEMLDVPRFDVVNKAQGTRTEVLVLPVRISLPPSSAQPPNIAPCLAFASIQSSPPPNILATLAQDTLLELDRQLRRAVAQLGSGAFAATDGTVVEQQACGLADAIRLAARLVLAEVVEEQEVWLVLSRGMIAFQAGLHEGFPDNAESLTALLGKHVLTVDAAAAERKRLKEQAAWDAELSRICALMDAAEDGDAEEVGRLLQEGVDVNSQTLGGTSALHQASSNGHEATAQLLLQSNADVNLCDSLGLQPLHKACRNGFLGVAAVLLEGGAPLESQVFLLVLARGD